MSSGFGWVLAAGLSACATVPADVTRTARADLGCSNAEVTKLASGRYGASGCGKGAVYAEVCDGEGCRVGRLRHGHEVEIGQRVAPPAAPAQREVIAAPAPAAHEVLPAPAPATREILPAPPPAGEASTSGGESSDAGASQTPVPLSQGELSAPYEAEVPATPPPQKVSSAPPEPLVEDRPAPPAPTYVWVGGYWWSGPSNWLWVPGYWCAPMVGYTYMPGYWYWGFGYWNYWPGGWGYPGSTVIAHAPAPRPRNVVVVRSFQPRPRAHVVTRHDVRGSSPSHVARGSRPAFSPRSSPLLRYPLPGGAKIASISPSRNSGYSGMGMQKGRSVAPSSKAGRSNSVGYRVAPSSVGKVVKPSSFNNRSNPRAAPAPRPSLSRGSLPRSNSVKVSPRPAPAPARRSINVQPRTIGAGRRR